jgi:tripartite-type tricarboxylate transporter receptor subunit TctC
MKHATRLLLAAFLAAAGSAAGAQDYPNRLVTIIVPYPAGGPTDQIARELAAQFSAKLGQNFVVENVSGGDTTIATGRVARATPDGYTLLLHNLQISANVALYPKLGFDTEKDLAPVGFINQNPLVLVGRKSLAPNTLSELIALMKREPLKMAHPGTGSTGHLATSLFANEAKVEAIQVPYRGAAPALQDIAGDHVDLFFATPQSVVEQVAAGQIKAYGITAKQGSPLFPKAASFVTEMGQKLEILYWHALFVPAGNAGAGDRQAQRRVATGRGRPRGRQSLGGHRCCALSQRSALAASRAGAAAFRDRALGSGGARERHSATRAIRRRIT